MKKLLLPLVLIAFSCTLALAQQNQPTKASSVSVQGGANFGDLTSFSGGLSYDTEITKWFGVGFSFRFDNYNNFPDYAKSLYESSTIQPGMLETLSTKTGPFDWERLRVMTFEVDLEFYPVDNGNSRLTTGIGVGIASIANEWFTATSIATLPAHSNYSHYHDYQMPFNFSVNVDYRYTFDCDFGIGAGVEMNVNEYVGGSFTPYVSLSYRF